MTPGRRQFSAWGLGAVGAATLGLPGCAWTQATARAGMDLYLLAGQSNMAGRGLVEAQDQVTIDGIETLNASGLWVPAAEPIHFDKPSVVGVGPGRAFGLAMAQARPSRRIGLVPCAVGGSPLSSWLPGASFEVSKGVTVFPFDDLLKRVRIASKAGTWRGILWHQGESDSNERDAPLHEARLTELIARLRAELGAAALPFVIGQMGRWPERAWTAPREQVDAAQRRVVAQVGQAAFVSAAGLGLHNDKLLVHFSAVGARELGVRYAQAMLALQG